MDLKILRYKINDIDQQIIELLSQRVETVQLINQEKLIQQLKIKDLKRERELKNFHRRLTLGYKLDYQFIEQLFDLIIDYNFKIQKNATDT